MSTGCLGLRYLVLRRGCTVVEQPLQARNPVRDPRRASARRIDWRPPPPAIPSPTSRRPGSWSR
eukprot:850903-Pyramimonas_sp.AAC.2